MKKLDKQIIFSYVLVALVTLTGIIFGFMKFQGIELILVFGEAFMYVGIYSYLYTDIKFNKYDSHFVIAESLKLKKTSVIIHSVISALLFTSGIVVVFFSSYRYLGIFFLLDALCFALSLLPVFISRLKK